MIRLLLSSWFQDVGLHARDFRNLLIHREGKELQRDSLSHVRNLCQMCAVTLCYLRIRSLL